MEVPLLGGNMTVGLVRVGDTVRRPPTDASGFVAAVLHHLQAVGFDGAPRHLGIDERGRDVLTFVDGVDHPRWQHWRDEQVVAAGRLLRRFHDATAGSAIAGPHEVVCHRDPGSQNMIFDTDDVPFAFIDFDGVEPGRRLEDVGYLAWSWCTWSSTHGGEDNPCEVQAHRLRVTADAYGLDAAGRAGLVDAIIGRQVWSVDFWRGRSDDPSAADHIASCLHEADRTRRLRPIFDAALA